MALQEHGISDGKEEATFHSLGHLSDFDPSSQFQPIAENSSTDGQMPLLSSDTSSSSDSLPSLVASEVVKSSPFHLFPEAGLQMEMELPSNQSHHGIMNVNALLRADQHIMMDQFVGMNHVSSFQFDPARNQIVIVTSESSQISHSNCGAFVIDESQGENKYSSIDGVSSNHPTGKRIRTFEEDIIKPFDGGEFSLACLPSVCSSDLPLQAMPIQQVSESSVAKKQVMKSSPFDPFPEDGLQMEMELPSNQSHHGIMNALLGADQQITMDQFVDMNHVSSFQFDPTRYQRVIDTSESSQIFGSNCGAFVIEESLGENIDSSIDGVSNNHSTGKRIHTFEEDITQPFDSSAFSLACLPSVCSSVLPLQDMPIQQVSEISVAKKQKTENSGREASARPLKALPFYNFMKLPHDIFVAERNAFANRCNDGREDSDAVNLDIKL